LKGCNTDQKRKQKTFFSLEPENPVAETRKVDRKCKGLVNGNSPFSAVGIL